jgi:hypothetical protein
MSPLLAFSIALLVGAAPSGCPEPTTENAASAAWCAALAARPRLALPTPADRQALRQVFERPELRRARADTAGLRRLLLGLWGRVMELLGTAEAERFAGVGRLVFILAGLATAVAGLAALRRRRAGTTPFRAEPAPATAPLPAPDVSAALAEGALARGDLTGAVRHAFLSALGALEDAGKLPRDRTLTNRELTDRLATASAQLAGEFGALGRIFDGAVYGGASVGDPEARSSLAAAARIRERSGGAR